MGTPSCFVHVTKAYEIICSLSCLAWVAFFCSDVRHIYNTSLLPVKAASQVPTHPTSGCKSACIAFSRVWSLGVFLRSTFHTCKLKVYQTLFLMTARVIAMICNKTHREVQICLLTSLYRKIFPEDQSFDGWIGKKGQFFFGINRYSETLSQLDWCKSAQNATKSEHLPWD